MHITVKKAKHAKKVTVPAFTNLEKFSKAREKLDEIIVSLKEVEKTEDPSADDLAELRSELADSYGMKGGIFRREGDLEAALSMYEAGLKWEQEDSTYNASNSIVLSIILKRQQPSDPEMRKRLETVIRKLESQVKGPRLDEWWAWADLGQFYLLFNEFEKALDCYKKGQENSGPNEKDYNSSIAVLETLKKSLGNSPLVTGIEAALKQLEEAAKKVALTG